MDVTPPPNPNPNPNPSPNPKPKPKPKPDPKPSPDPDPDPNPDPDPDPNPDPNPNPAYDQVTWNATESKMLIYDIGMTAEWLGEVDALIDLAATLNKPEDVSMLQARKSNMSAKVQSTLWNEALEIYLNYQQDTQTFNTHTSPTSFYPMLSGTATLDQALAMTRRWLTNHSGYCLGNFTHDSYRPDTSLNPCKYALPSTPNSDPAYKNNNYWRGRVWGPLNLLVYMGLKHPKYASHPEITAARKQLTGQSRDALMVEWLPKHHVHENLNPDTGLGDDVHNSNPMYHWGALLGFIEMWETGNF